MSGQHSWAGRRNRDSAKPLNSAGVPNRWKGNHVGSIAAVCARTSTIGRFWVTDMSFKDRPSSESTARRRWYHRVFDVPWMHTYIWCWRVINAKPQAFPSSQDQPSTTRNLQKPVSRDCRRNGCDAETDSFFSEHQGTPGLFLRDLR